MTAERITRTARCRGVELATWAAGRCVLAHLGTADRRWLQLADVVVCPPGTTRARLWAVTATLPGCGVVATRLERHSVLAVRGLGDLVIDDEQVVARALECYSVLVSVGPSSAVSLARTCRALGIPARL